MTTTRRSFWLTLLLITASCAGLRPMASPVVVTPTAMVTASPTVLPTINPTPTVTPSPTSTPTPILESRWQCYPSGGLACFDVLISITMLSADEGWATTLKHHGVLHYTTRPDDSVPTWQLVERSEVVPFTSLVMVSPTEGWAIGTSSEAAFVHYKDGQWEGIPGRCCADDLTMVSPDEGWAVGFGGLIVHYTDGEWQEVVTPVTRGGEDNLHTIVMLSPTEGWAAGSQNTLLHYDGQQWQPVEREGRSYFHSLFKMEKVSKTEIWAVGDGIHHYKDGIWQRVTNLDYKLTFTDLSMVNANEGWAIEQSGSLFHYQNGRWQEVDSPTENHLYSIDMINAEEGWAVGENSTILHYQNSDWTLVSETVPPTGMVDITWSEDGTSWGVGESGFWQYRDEIWQPIDTIPPDVDGAAAIDMISPSEGWAVGGNGKILHYNQGSWQLAPSPTSKHLRDIDLVNKKEGWAVGVDGLILHYANNEWREVTSPTSVVLYGVSMGSEREGWAVGQRGVMLHYQDGIWEPIQLIVENDLQDVHMFNETEGWASGGGVLLRYHNDAWEQVSLPSDYKVSVMGMFSPDDGWIMSGSSALHYKQGTWDIVDLPLGLNLSAMYMVNEYEGWAVGGTTIGGGILHYTNEQ